MSIDYWLIIGFAFVGLGYILVSAATKVPKNARKSASDLHTDTQSEFLVYKQRTAKEPLNPQHWVEWGNALVASGRQARTTNMRIHRYNEAFACYAQATEVAESYAPAWLHWGLALYDQAKLQRCSDILLLEGGHNKFRTLINLSPQNAEYWKRWGDELTKLAQCIGGEQQKILSEQAQECFEQVALLQSGAAKGAQETAVATESTSMPITTAGATSSVVHKTTATEDVRPTNFIDKQAPLSSEDL